MQARLVPHLARIAESGDAASLPLPRLIAKRMLPSGNPPWFRAGVVGLSDPLLVRKEVCELRDRFSRCQ